MTVPKAPGAEFDDPLGSPPTADGLHGKAARLFVDIQRQTRPLCPTMQASFFVTLGLLVLGAPAVLVIGLAGAPLGGDHDTYAISVGFALAGMMVVLYGLARRSEKREASEAFGRRIDRRPRL